jgi:hypothetical protein
MYFRLLLALTALMFLLPGCSPSKRSTPAILPASFASAQAVRDASSRTNGFADVTQAAGIDFLHSVGETQLTNLVESTGGGLAFLDYDSDGNMDVYVVSGVHKPPFTHGSPPPFQPRNRLYHNRGDGTFEDVTDRAGVGLGDRYCIAVAVGDYDNDDHPDIFIACYYGPNVLFHNNGNGAFTDVAQKAGVADMACSDGGVWFDYDNDGYLDLYVCNYIQYDPNYHYYYNPDGFPGPLSYEGQQDALYHNNRNGTFTSVTKEMGVEGHVGRAMGAVAADYDDDGMIDLYVANDAMEKYLFHNEGGKHFTEVANQAGVAFNVAGEGTASMIGTWGDYDNDGRLDLFVPDNSFKSLFHNEGNGMFTDAAAPTGIAGMTGQYVSWGSGWIDYDNDGSPDLFIVNGALHHLYGQEAVLLHNDGDGKFSDVSTQAGEFFKRKVCGRGAAFGDFDNDGNVDVVITTLNGPAILLRNCNRSGNHWLALRLVGHKSNRDGVGAKVKLVYDGKTRVAQREGGGAYLSSNDPRLHFGLGKCRKVDRIEIRWPSGIPQTLKDVKPDQILTVEEPKG